jgi:3-oxoacyl-[acyl-carrier-protein] synthase-3
MKNKLIAGISAVSHYLPQLVRTSAEVEELINVHLKPAIQAGSIERLTGIITRYVSREDEYNSTLAIEACRLLFEKENINPNKIDLLIFASTGQDILEPATAHIVQEGIGTHCRVMDIKNACNGFIDAFDVAVSLIETGRHKNVLIATGEVPSKAAKFDVVDRDLLQQYLVGHTFGDCGTAVLITENPTIASVLDSYFFSESSNWDVAMFPGGGSRFLNQRDAYFFRGDATALMEPFFIHTKRLLQDFLRRNNISLSEIEHIFVHQVAEFVLDKVCDDLQIPKAKIQVTIKEYGNVAAASLPLALDLRLKSQIIFSGTLGLFIGFAGGFSIGFTLVKF